jgi:hypothetical protein
MADFKKLIGNALNKANSSKPSDDGIKTKTRKAGGLTVKRAEVLREKGYMNEERPNEPAKKKKRIGAENIVAGIATGIYAPIAGKKLMKKWNLPE